MYKVFISLILVMCLCVSLPSFSAVSSDVQDDLSDSVGLVEDDNELHKVIGGLYTLAAVVNINQNSNPDPRQLRNYFDNLPKDWLEKIKISRKVSSVWVGILVDQKSRARNYLRVNAPSLKITSDPEGYDWLGGYYAWIKAADIINNKLQPLNLIATKSDGALFFSTKDQKKWWQADPTFNFRAEKMVMKNFEINDAPMLEKPKALTNSNSVYERVKPNDKSRKPDEIHISTKKGFLEKMSIEMGDVLFNPIPNTR